MTYAELLKKLISISGLKSKEIANYIGYDSSYISKWTTGKNLPSSKSYPYVNTKLAQLFTDAIISNNSVNKISGLTNRKIVLANSNIIKSVVAALLQQAFFVSVEQLSLEEFQLRDRQLFCGEKEIEEAFLNICGSVMATNNGSIRLLSTNPLEFYIPILNKFNNIFYVIDDVPVSFTILVDPSSLPLRTNFKLILELSLQFSAFNLKVKEFNEYVDTHSLIINNQIMLTFEYDRTGRPMFMFNSLDPDSIETYSSQINQISHESTSILKTTSDIEDEGDIVRGMLENDNIPIFYFSYLPAQSIPGDAVKAFVKKYKLNDDMIKKMDEIIKVHMSLLENTKCKIIFSEKAIYNCVINRTINYCNENILLSTAEMRYYLMFVKNYVLGKSNLSFYIQLENGYEINFAEYRQSFVTDRKTTIFTKDQALSMKNSAKYMLYEHPDFSDTLYDYLEEQMTGKSFKPITNEQMIQILDRYLILL